MRDAAGALARARAGDWETRPYYPAILDIAGRTALVVGAGKVGEGKIEGLLNGGAHGAGRLARPPPTRVRALGRARDGSSSSCAPTRASDLDGCFLVIAATEDNDTNVRVFEDAEARQMLCNVVDVTHLCNFILPSIVRRGDLAIAVSTGGASPAMARRIRLALGECYGDEYAVALRAARLAARGAEGSATRPRRPQGPVRADGLLRTSWTWCARATPSGIEAWIERCIDEGPGYASPGRAPRRCSRPPQPECKLRFAAARRSRTRRR